MIKVYYSLRQKYLQNLTKKPYCVSTKLMCVMRNYLKEVF